MNTTGKIAPVIKPTPLKMPLEEADPTWLCDRWEFAYKANDSSGWFKMGNVMHCCAMVIWESNSTQRLEYLTLSSLADQHGLNCEEEKQP